MGERELSSECFRLGLGFGGVGCAICTVLCVGLGGKGVGTENFLQSNISSVGDLGHG